MEKVGVVTFVLLWSCCLGIEIGLTIQISPGKQECFWQHLPVDTDTEVEYQVVAGGDLDINLLISGPENRVYHIGQRKTDNVVKFKSTDEGDYKLCFDNAFSRLSSKIVFFKVFIKDLKNDSDDNADGNITFEEEGIMGQLDITVQDFMGILDRSKRNMERSIQIQTLIRVHEAKDRNVQEANFFRVNFFSCLQLVLMITLGLIQVIMIRSLFQDKLSITGSSIKTRT